MHKILLIEDDPHMRKLVRDNLELHGYEVLLAQDGAFGLSLSTLEKPDLILLDIMMPVMDGIETLKTLRAEPGLSDTPVIVLTAADDPNVERDARHIGVAAFFKKPVNVDKLLASIQGTLRFQGRKA